MNEQLVGQVWARAERLEELDRQLRLLLLRRATEQLTGGLAAMGRFMAATTVTMRELAANIAAFVQS